MKCGIDVGRRRGKGDGGGGGEGGEGRREERGTTEESGRRVQSGGRFVADFAGVEFDPPLLLPPHTKTLGY